MEINRVNTAGAAADRSFEFAAKKSASTDPGSSSEKSATNIANITKVDVAKIENKMSATDSKVTEEFLQKMIDRANKQLRGSNREFSYSVHERTGQFVIKIVDQETKEVIREIPPEKSLDAVANMWDLMGVFVDEKT